MASASAKVHTCAPTEAAYLDYEVHWSNGETPEPFCRKQRSPPTNFGYSRPDDERKGNDGRPEHPLWQLRGTSIGAGTGSTRY